LIKPGDTKAFESAIKFKKELFRVDRASSGSAEDITDEMDRVEGEEPQGRIEKARLKAERLIGEADEKAERLIGEANEKAGLIKAQAADEAERMLTEAKDQAEDIFRKARERGRADGAQEVREQAERRHDASAKMLSSFIEQMKKRESDMTQSIVPKLAGLAADLAEKIIHREIGRDSSLATRQAEQAITRILERDRLLIRVNPSDEKLMKEHKPTLMEMFDGIDRIEVIGDPEVEPGGCIVETDLIKVDAQPRAQIKAARSAILKETEK
jgi:flagellar assembly protein FliH